ncbi:MAG: O-antigen ligase family protein [bacterium]
MTSDDGASRGGGNGAGRRSDTAVRADAGGRQSFTVPRRFVFIGTASLLLIVPYVFCTYTNDVFLLPKLAVALAIAVPVAGASLCVKLAEGTAGRLPLWMKAAALAFLAVGLFASTNVAVSAGCFAAALAGFLFFTAVADTDWTEREIDVFIAVAAVATAGTAVYSIMQFFDSELIFDRIPRLQETIQERKIVRGFLGHADHTGAFLAVTAPFTLASAFYVRGIALRALLAAVTLAAVSALLVTMTRAAWISGAAALVVFCLALSLRKGVRFFALFFSLAALASVFLFFFFSAFAVTEGQTLITRLFSIPDAKYGANASRLTLWGTALLAWDARPLTGAGLGVYHFVFPKFQPEFIERYGAGFGLSPVQNVVRAHNEFLQAGAETGWVGVALAAAFVSGVAVYGVRSLLRAPARRAHLAAGCLAAVTAVLVDSVFMFPMHLAATAFYALFFAALVFPLGARANETRAPARPRAATAPARLAALSLSALVTLACWLHLARLVEANALVLPAPGAPYLDRLERARRLDPANGYIPFLIGRELFFKGMLNDALDAFAAAERTYDSTALHFYKSLVYRRLGMPDYAAVEERKAIENGFNPPQIFRQAPGAQAPAERR